MFLDPSSHLTIFSKGSGPLVAPNGLFLDEICAELNLNGSGTGSGNLSPTSAAEATSSCCIPGLPREAKWQRVNRVLMSSLDEAFGGNNKAVGIDLGIAGSCVQLNLDGTGSGNLSPTSCICG